MKVNPLKGMKDYLPEEMRIRDYVQGEILKVYRQSGFERIATPMLEDIENLDKSEGGDNLNLIFKVLKRGDKLDAAMASGEEKNLSDMGRQPRQSACALQGHPDGPRVPRRTSPEGPYARIYPVRYRHPGR